MATRLRALTEIPSCCPPRAAAIALGVSTTWDPTATVGHLRPETPAARGSSASIPAECSCATATVASVDPSGLSKINDCARKSAITGHTKYFIISIITDI